jgi:hypothetical protein
VANEFGDCLAGWWFADRAAATPPVKISTSTRQQLNIIIADKRGNPFKITTQIRPNDREGAGSGDDLQPREA